MNPCAYRLWDEVFFKEIFIQNLPLSPLCHTKMSALLPHPHITTTTTTHAPCHAPPVHQHMHGEACPSPNAHFNPTQLGVTGLHDTAAAAI